MALFIDTKNHFICFKKIFHHSPTNNHKKYHNIQRYKIFLNISKAIPEVTEIGIERINQSTKDITLN